MPRSLAPFFVVAVAALLAACGGMESPLDGSTTDAPSADAVAQDTPITPDAPIGSDVPVSPDARPPSGHTDPGCTDGRYTETLPDQSARVDDVAFSAGNLTAFYTGVLDRRYANGTALVRGGLMNTTFGDCVAQFAGSPTTAAAAFRSVDTVVHECGHLYDSQLGRGMGASTNVYFITSARSFMCTRGDATNRNGDTFARSRIRGDSYSAARMPCNGTSAPGCDFYADVYLDGNPDDTTFQGGDQGFNMVLEETVQYVNSLATSYAFVDRLASGSRTSARDGILTFLWYVERYLHMARTMFPAAYTRISGDACWRDAILTVWGRAWLYLDASETMTALGINDRTLLGLVNTPELLDEIARIRAASSCP